MATEPQEVFPYPFWGGTPDGVTLATGIETESRLICYDQPSSPVGEFDAVAFVPQQTITISNIYTVCTAGGSGMTLCRMGIYTDDRVNQVLTLVARTANDPTLWTAAGGYQRALDSTGGFPASYQLQRGVAYRLARVHAGGASAIKLRGSDPGGSAPMANILPYPWLLKTGEADLGLTYAYGVLTPYNGMLYGRFT